MNTHQAIEFVEESEKYKTCKKEHPECYLAHAFCTIEKKEQSPWQLGYYSKKTKKIIAFTAGKEIIQHDEDEAFNKEGDIPPLTEQEVTISLEEAMKHADKYKEEHHSAEVITKRIIILQTLEGEPTWNITLVTNAFSLINVRVHAKTGEVISTTADSIMNLGTRT